MRCPKCGYISFDSEESCDKCGRALAEVAAALRGPVFRATSPAFLAAVLRPVAAAEDDAGELFAPQEAGESDEFELGGEVAEGLELGSEDAGGGLALAADLDGDEFDLDELGAEPPGLEPSPLAGLAGEESDLETEATAGAELDLGGLPADDEDFSLESAGLELDLTETPGGAQLEPGAEAGGDEFDLGGGAAAEEGGGLFEAAELPGDELDLGAVAAPDEQEPASATGAEPPADELELTLEPPAADELELSLEPAADELEFSLEPAADELEFSLEPVGDELEPAGESAPEDDADGLTDLMDLVYGDRQERPAGGEVEDIVGLFDQPAPAAPPPPPGPDSEIPASGLKLESDDGELDLGLSLEDDEELK